MVTVIEAYRTDASNNVTGVTPAPLLRYDRPTHAGVAEWQTRGT